MSRIVATTEIESLLREEGFENFGFAELVKPVSIGLYESWLESGFHGEMDYLRRHLPEKREPQRLLPRARSAIVLTKNYVPHPEPLEKWPLSASAKVAGYARGRDYHHFLGAKLKVLSEKLRERYPGEEFVFFTDSGPVLERDLASRAGLGWIGKNTCLLSRAQGSLFFIAEIYTTLAFDAAKIETTDHCGTCTRCLDACPTGALRAPRELDARLCISYLTIESRETPPAELRPRMGDWLFGCDICQTVCPWNLKVHGKETIARLEPATDEARRAELIEDLRMILSSSNRGLERAFAGTPLARPGAFGMKRNALVVAANRGLTELQSEIEKLAGDARLSELAAWTLERLNP